MFYRCKVSFLVFTLGLPFVWVPPAWAVKSRVTIVAPIPLPYRQIKNDYISFPCEFLLGNFGLKIDQFDIEEERITGVAESSKVDGLSLGLQIRDQILMRWGDQRGYSETQKKKLIEDDDRLDPGRKSYYSFVDSHGNLSAIRIFDGSQKPLFLGNPNEGVNTETYFYHLKRIWQDRGLYFLKGFWRRKRVSRLISFHLAF